MRNKNGFVMTETLIVTVFLVTIFTFIYVSIVPLLGKYDDLSYRKSDIDIVYKLYNIRKYISKNNKENIISSGFHEINCSYLSQGSEEKLNYCNTLMEYLELRQGNRDNYLLVYADSIQDRLENFSSLSSDTSKEMYDYVNQNRDFSGKVLVLLIRISIR